MLFRSVENVEVDKNCKIVLTEDGFLIDRVRREKIFDTPEATGVMDSNWLYLDKGNYIFEKITTLHPKINLGYFSGLISMFFLLIKFMDFPKKFACRPARFGRDTNVVILPESTVLGVDY